MKSWMIYIVKARSGALYTGISTDPLRRFAQHRSGRAGARFFRMDPPEAIVYLEAAPDHGHALRREHEIKRMTRRERLALVQSLDPRGA